MRLQKGPKRVDTNVVGVKSCWFFNNTWENLLKGVEFDATHFIIDVSGKYPRLWALKGAHPITVNRWYKFGALASIRSVSLGFREILELPDWVFNAVHESWHNNPHLKKGRKRIEVVLGVVEEIHDRNHEVAAVGLNCEEQFVKVGGYGPIILQLKDEEIPEGESDDSESEEEEFMFQPLVGGEAPSAAVDEAYYTGVYTGLIFRSLLTGGSFDSSSEIPVVEGAARAA
ncbi:hypothetical protein ACS0TY_004046 [Phlomoides rotata]